MKKKNNSESLTLDAQYNKKINEFEKRQNKIKSLKNNLKSNNKKLDFYINKTKKKMNDEEFESYFKLLDKIKNIQNEIHNLNSFEKESEYFLNTGNILSEYYSEKKKIEKNIYSSEKKSDCMSDPNVINFFFNKTHSINHTILLNDYLQTINENYTNKKINKIDTNQCKICNVEMLVYSIEGILECPQCSRVEYNVMDYSKPSYNDPPPEISYFAYKRINHFNELFYLHKVYSPIFTYIYLYIQTLIILNV